MGIPRAILSCVIIYYRLLRSGGMRLLTSCSKKKRIVLSPLAQWLSLFRKNNPPFRVRPLPARPGPSLPWPLSPSALRPFLPRGVKFFRKKAPRPLACPVKVLTFAPAFRKGGAPGGGRGGPGKKSSGLREKSLAVPEETLTFAARFPLERGSPGRDGSSGPGGEKSDL